MIRAIEQRCGGVCPDAVIALCFSIVKKKKLKKKKR